MPISIASLSIFILYIYLSMSVTSTSPRTLLPFLNQIRSKYSIILASASPRRKELLSLMGLTDFETVVSNFPEDIDMRGKSPQEYCLQTATQKVLNVSRMVQERFQTKPVLIIGADTIVEINGNILEKPKDDLDAARMLTMLSGSEQSVHTAVVLFSNFLSDGKGAITCQETIEPCRSFVETSKVTFSDLSEADINAYIETGEGKDKAGSYGIQGLGGQMVKGIQGCYFNVMGLPVHALSNAIAELMVNG